MDAVDPDLIDAGLDWLPAERNKSYTASSAQRTNTRVLRREVARWAPDRSVRPWQSGWQQARHVRRALGLDESARFEPARFVASFQSITADRGLQGVGGADPGEQPLVVLAHRRPQNAQRFILSRAFWHVVLACRLTSTAVDLDVTRPPHDDLRVPTTELEDKAVAVAFSMAWRAGGVEGLDAGGKGVRSRLTAFRAELHGCFTARADALFELVSRDPVNVIFLGG